MAERIRRKFKPKHLSSAMYRKAKGEQPVEPQIDLNPNEGVKEELLTQGKKVKQFHGIIY